MQGLWSRAAARLPSSCRCNACLRTYANGVASRPATTTSRRGLRVGNAVTALYSSIFAGAAIADAKAKQKRRQEWDDKIAAVQEEVDELVDEERRLLEALSIRKPRQSIINLQSRHYSTSSRPAAFETRNLRGSHSLASRALRDEEPLEPTRIDDYISRKEWRSSGVPGGSNPALSTPFAEEDMIHEHATTEKPQVQERNQEEIDDEEMDNLDYGFAEDVANMSRSIPRPDPDFIWERSRITRIKAIQKLAVQQLVYRLLLRPSIVHDYSGLPVEYKLDESEGRSPSILLRRLQAVRRRLYSLKYVKESTFDDLMQNVGIEELDRMRREVRERYDTLLKQDVQQYVKGKMPLQKLLMRVADNFMACEEPDRPHAFALLINAFSKTHQNDLADLVLKCLIPNLFQFSTPLIINIISHFRKTKNLKDFDLFLQMLRGDGGYSVNLRTTWQKKTVNGIMITVPPMSSFNPVILTSVIKATLRFDQPEKAEAYMHIAHAHGFVDNFATLSAFLRFYSVRKDFKSGSSTLLRSLKFIVSSSDFEEKRVARLILYMADFCASCDRDDLSDMLIHAAIRSGFDYSTAHRPGETSTTSYLTKTHNKWQQAQDDLGIEPSEQERKPSLNEKCAVFAAMTEEKISHSQLKSTNNGVPDPRYAVQDAYARSKYIKLQSDSNNIDNTTKIPLSAVPPPPTSQPSSDLPLKPSLDSSSELKSLRSQLDVLYLRIEELSSVNNRTASTESEKGAAKGAVASSVTDR